MAKPPAKKTPKPDPELPEQLRAAIERMGLTTYAVAELTGVDSAVIGRFLSGERDVRLATAGRIAAGLGLKLVEVKGAKRR